MLIRSLVVGMGVVAAGSALARGIEAECLRNAASPGAEVCACVQDLADRMLLPADQRETVKIIADPDRYGAMRRKSSRSAEAFVERYRAWGERSEEVCGALAAKER